MSTKGKSCPCFQKLVVSLFLEPSPDYLHSEREHPLAFNEETYVLQRRYAGKTISVNPALYRKEATQAMHFCSDRLIHQWLYVLSFPSYWTPAHAARKLLKQAVATGKRIDCRESVSEQFSESPETDSKTS